MPIRRNLNSTTQHNREPNRNKGRRNMLKTKRGNHKLSKDILVFNLPTGHTCPGAGECINWCYAKKPERMFRRVREARNHNYLETKKDTFTTEMNKTLKEQGNKIKYVRIHESGDLYNQQYLNKWITIAKHNKHLTFYIYTKSHTLNFKKAPRNLVIIHSYGSNNDSAINPQIHNTARTIHSTEELQTEEYLCPYHEPTFSKCGETCKVCMTQTDNPIHIAFLKH